MPHSFFSRGRGHGRAFRQAIVWNLEHFFRRAERLGLAPADLVRRGRELADSYSPALIEEIRGIAQGAALDPERLLAFNLCYGSVVPDDCTVLFALGDATASGKTLFLKNSDKIGGDSMVGPGFHDHKEINVVLAIPGVDGPDIIGVSAAGSTGLKMGVNSLGVAVGANLSRTRELASRGADTSQMRALDRIQLAREGLEKGSALSAATYAAARLAETPTATPGNIEFIDSSTAVVVEGSYDRVALQVIRSGVGSRPNCFEVLSELNNPEDVSSHCRFARTRQLLGEHYGKLTPELMRRFSQDHANGPGPNSICRHGSHYREETSQSSLVVEIDAENPRRTRYWISLGKPCHAWRHPEAQLEGTMERVDGAPPGFLNGDVWKRFWVETPLMEAAAAAHREG